MKPLRNRCFPQSTRYCTFDSVGLLRMKLSDVRSGDRRKVSNVESRLCRRALSCDRVILITHEKCAEMSTAYILKTMATNGARRRRFAVRWPIPTFSPDTDRTSCVRLRRWRDIVLVALFSDAANGTAAINLQVGSHFKRRHRPIWCFSRFYCIRIELPSDVTTVVSAKPGSAVFRVSIKRYCAIPRLFLLSVSLSCSFIFPR